MISKKPKPPKNLEFKETKASINELLLQEEKYERELLRKTDWRNTSDVSFLKKERRLKQVPKNRTCPNCLEIKASPRSWVVKDGWAVCRKCYYIKLYETPILKKSDILNLPFLGPPCKVYHIDEQYVKYKLNMQILGTTKVLGFRLKKKLNIKEYTKVKRILRDDPKFLIRVDIKYPFYKDKFRLWFKETGVSRSKLARTSGWTRGFIQKLEEVVTEIGGFTHATLIESIKIIMKDKND